MEFKLKYTSGVFPEKTVEIKTIEDLIKLSEQNMDESLIIHFEAKEIEVYDDLRE